jgi:hypothetical protein
MSFLWKKIRRIIIMTDWKEQLNKKVESLNIKEVKDGDISVRSNSRSSDSVRSPISTEVRKDINKVIEKGGIVMITKEAALDDLKKIDVNAPIGKVIVEVGGILIKILATIRSNQLLTEEEKVNIRKAREARAAKENKEQK